MTYIPPETLEAAVQQGQISQMAAVNIISKQNAQAAALATTLGAERVRTRAQKQREAGKEVTGYLDRFPALRNPESPEFQRVVQRAGELAQEFGTSADDYRIHKMAMKEVLGPASVDTGRRVRDTAPRTTPTAGEPKTVNDPLKGVPQEFVAHWERLNYTPERMKAEAKYITRAPRKAAR